MPEQSNDAVERQGWICPQCGNVYAPHVDGCHACNGGMDKSLEEELEDVRDFVRETEQESGDKAVPHIMPPSEIGPGIPILTPCRPCPGSRMDPTVKLFNPRPENTDIDYSALEGIDAESDN